MLLRRVSILGLAVLSLGGVVAVANSNKFLPQTVAQTIDQSRPSHNQNGLVQALNLTPAQLQKMQAIRKQYKEQISQSRLQLRRSQQHLSNEIAGTAPADQVRATHRRVEALQQQLGDLRFESTLAVRELLTPEQRLKYVQRMQKYQQAAMLTQQQSQKN